MTMGWQWSAVVLAALTVAVLLAGDVRAQAQGPGSAVVDSLHQALEDNMRQGATRSFDERARLLEPVVLGAFDFATITRIALGRNWKSLSPEQRQAFQELMQRLSVNTYAARFSEAKNAEHFVIASEQTARGGRLLVRTRLERDNDRPVSLDYVLQGTGADLRIVNVLAEGVSDLSLRRAEFAAVIRDHGVSDLRQRLTAQVEDLARDARE